MRQPGTRGPCDFCRSEAYLYPRANKLACRGCVELGITPGRVSMTSPNLREIDLRDNPLSQPPTRQIYTRHMGNCVHCGDDASSVYDWQGTLAYACGWGHAGIWMDGEIATLEATYLLTGGTT